jgi:hypothetical protein
MAAKAPLILFDEVVEQAKRTAHQCRDKISPVRFARGNLCAGGVITDVTERRRLEEEICASANGSSAASRRICTTAWASVWPGVSVHDRRAEGRIWWPADRTNRPKAGEDFPPASMPRWQKPADWRAGLHPVEEQPHGLMSALSDLVAQVTHMFKIRCRFLCPRAGDSLGTIPPPPTFTGSRQ